SWRRARSPREPSPLLHSSATVRPCPFGRSDPDEPWRRYAGRNTWTSQRTCRLCPDADRQVRPGHGRTVRISSLGLQRQSKRSSPRWSGAFWLVHSKRSECWLRCSLVFSFFKVAQCQIPFVIFHTDEVCLLAGFQKGHAF